MDKDITPMTEVQINTKQNLIMTDQPEQQDNQNKEEVGQLFIEQNNKSSNKLDIFTITFLICRVYAIGSSIVIFSTSFIFSYITREFNIVFSIPLTVLFILVLLIFLNNKLLIIKDQANNKVIIKLMNFLCWPKKK